MRISPHGKRISIKRIGLRCEIDSTRENKSLVPISHRIVLAADCLFRQHGSNVRFHPSKLTKLDVLALGLHVYRLEGVSMVCSMVQR
jgi:hypothetical protein